MPTCWPSFCCLDDWANDCKLLWPLGVLPLFWGRMLIYELEWRVCFLPETICFCR